MIAFEIAKPTISKNYHEELIGFGVNEALSVPDYEVFAFQEMNRNNGAPRNDKNIFSAVTSLMKAQAYELGALSQRKKKPSSYQFNLLSIIESDLVRLAINNDDTIIQETVEAEHYIFRYIIKKNETFSRIRFIAYSSFQKKLKDYDRLHEANCKWFDKAINCFYEGVLKDYKRSNVLLEDFRANIWWDIHWLIKQKHDVKIDKSDIGVGWNDEGKFATVEIFCNDLIIQSLNEDLILREKIADAFKVIYRYVGDCKFAESDIPF